MTTADPAKIWTVRNCNKKGSKIAKEQERNEYHPKSIQIRITINYYLKRQTPRPEQVTVAIKQPSAMPCPQTEDAAYPVH